jgi:hypothetical protein
MRAWKDATRVPLVLVEDAARNVGLEGRVRAMCIAGGEVGRMADVGNLSHS